MNFKMKINVTGIIPEGFGVPAYPGLFYLTEARKRFGEGISGLVGCPFENFRRLTFTEEEARSISPLFDESSEITVRISVEEAATVGYVKYEGRQGYIPVYVSYEFDKAKLLALLRLKYIQSVVDGKDRS